MLIFIKDEIIRSFKKSQFAHMEKFKRCQLTRMIVFGEMDPATLSRESDDNVEHSRPARFEITSTTTANLTQTMMPINNRRNLCDHMPAQNDAMQQQMIPYSMG